MRQHRGLGFSKADRPARRAFLALLREGVPTREAAERVGMHLPSARTLASRWRKAGKAPPATYKRSSP